jgi:hypothetical protein
LTAIGSPKPGSERKPELEEKEAVNTSPTDRKLVTQVCLRGVWATCGLRDKIAGLEVDKVPRAGANSGELWKTQVHPSRSKNKLTSTFQQCLLYSYITKIPCFFS